MAWDDLVRSINDAARILRIDVTERDMPDSYPGLVQMNKDLWGRVRAKNADRKNRKRKPPEKSDDENFTAGLILIFGIATAMVASRRRT